MTLVPAGFATPERIRPGAGRPSPVVVRHRPFDEGR